MSKSGTTLVIGQAGRSLSPLLQGAVHVFKRNPSTFSLQQAFVAPGIPYNTSDGFGLGVALDGPVLGVAQYGALRTFVRHGAVWSPGPVLSTATGTSASHNFVRDGGRFFLVGNGVIELFASKTGATLLPLPSLAAEGVSNQSSLAVDGITLAVTGDHGVHVFEHP